MKNILFLILTTFSFLTANAAGKSSNTNGVKYTIEPLVGYETVFRTAPTAHTSTRTMYGARLSAGIDVASAEVEYTKASDTENYLTAPQIIKNDDEKLKLGVKSTYRLNEFIFTTLRLGGQATKSIRSETTNNVTAQITDPIKYDPYAGASVGVKLGPLSISVGATAVIRDVNDVSKNDIQNTLSVSMGN